MMRNFQSLIIFFALLGGELSAQVRFYDASEFPLLGKATQVSATRYERFPDSLRTVSRGQLWELSQNSAGMAIRFRSNTTQVGLQWEVLLDRHMNHMTDVGVKGLDLYCWEKDLKQWRFVNSARPSGKKNQVTIVANMEPKEREFMLYLPLYDGVTSLRIGVDASASMEQPSWEYPTQNQPIVFYGTSILQGACASRPGMAHTNIISRRLNRECINLGFSGNAFLDSEVAHILAEVDAAVYVLDFVPNASVDQMEERMEDFYRIIREKHPITPIVFVEDPVFAHAYYCKAIAGEIERKNRMLQKQFSKLKKQGEKHIYLVKSDKMLGEDGEATVDGIHFTDLGMMRYADLLTLVIKKIIK